jgi:hypothetical protein
MTSTITPIHYPSGDGKPIAETFDHVNAIMMTVFVLVQYLKQGSPTTNPRSLSGTLWRIVTLTL